MNTLNITDDWSRKKKSLQQSFEQLTDEDLRYTQGREEELLGRVQRRLEIPEYIAKKLIRYC